MIIKYYITYSRTKYPWKSVSRSDIFTTKSACPSSVKPLVPFRSNRLFPENPPFFRSPPLCRYNAHPLATPTCHLCILVKQLGRKTFRIHYDTAVFISSVCKNVSETTTNVRNELAGIITYINKTKKKSH